MKPHQDDPSKFTLSIQLGNEAMQSPSDVAHALRSLADKFDAYQAPSFAEAGLAVGAGKVRDVNGNTVGKWAVA